MSDYAKRKIAECAFIRQCGKAEMCLAKLEELNGMINMFAWHDAHDAGYTYHPSRPFMCRARLEPRLKGLKGWRVEFTYKDGWKQRFWIVRTRFWMPAYMSVARRGVRHAQPIYLEDTTKIETVDYDKRMEQW